MINLSKEEIQILLLKIREDRKHYDKYLFLRLQYFYGRRSHEIVSLKVSDIDFVNEEITFNIAKKKEKTTLTLSIFKDMMKDIKKYIKDCQLDDEDYIFIKKSNAENFKRTIRSYLQRNSNKLITDTLDKDIELDSHDFRRLRGQHLYLAGHSVEVIQKLYYHASIEQTLDYLQINELEVNRMLKSDME